MRRPCGSLWVVLLVFAATLTAAFADTYDTATLVRITPLTQEDVQVLYDNHLDIVGLSKGVYKALVTDEQMQLLTRLGFGIEVLYAEMQDDRARWAEASASYGLATSYYTPSKFSTTSPPAGSLMEHLLQQYTAHPDITRLYNLGASQDGAYDIIAMKVSKNPDAVEAEPKIRIYGNIHGDEKGGVMVACDVLDTILAGYTAAPQDPTAKKLVDETEMWFIPIGNPYGNANNTRYNSTGTDLNRNFWGPSGSDAPPAWSQKETQVIRDLTEAATPDHTKKRFAVSLSFHEGDAVFNSVWNYTTAASTDEPIFWSSRTGGTGCGSQTIPNCPTIAPHGLAQAYKDGCTMPGFWYTEGYDWYGTRGDTNDWAYGAWTQLDTTIELNTTKTPPASSIPTYCAEHRPAVLNYMMKVFQGIHGVMTDLTTGQPVDGTVAATATVSSSIPVPHAYQAIYTDSVAGDFHRVLQPGTYTIVCAAPGYMSTTLAGLVVNPDAKTVANCVMNKTGLAYGSSSAGDSCGSGGAYSGDGILDAGEDATLQLSLTNPGSVAATSVQGTISTAAPGISVTQPAASFGDVAGGGSGSSLAPHFHFSVDPSIACGTAIPFNIHMTSAQGAWDDTFNVTVGQVVNGSTTTVVSESFDGTAFPPSGWAQQDTSGTAGNWARSTGTVHPTGGGTHSGAGLAYFNSYTSASGSQTRLYRTAGASLPASAASASVTFWMYHDTNSSGTNDRVQIQVSTNGGSTWTSVGSAVSRYATTAGWQQHTVSLASYIGQSGVQVGFLGISAFGYDCHIDDVQIAYTAATTCTMHACSAPVSADLVASASAPAQSATGASVSYTLGVIDNGPGAAANVQIQSGTPAGTTFVSWSAPPGWTCSLPAVGSTGAVSCTLPSLASGGSASFTLTVELGWCVGNGVPVGASISATSSTSDTNVPNNSASASTSAIDNGSCDDGNGCTINDGCTAGVCGGTVITVPGETHDLSAATDKSTFSWAPDAGATHYDVARGDTGSWPDHATGGVCFGNLGEPSVADTAIPTIGSGFWYLSRAINSCGAGSYGLLSDGTPRTSTVCP